MLKKILGVLFIVVAACARPSFAGDAHPLQLSLYAPMQTVPEHQPVSGLRASLLYTSNTDVRGLSLGLGVNRTSGGFRGVELALADWADQEVYGWQAGVVGRAGKRMVGWQSALVSVTDGGFSGVQTAVVAWSGVYVHGWQAGAVNRTGYLTGLQTGGVNIATDMVDGVQLGVCNNADFDLYGVQMGFANWAAKMHGLQLGVVNVAEALDGVQIGLFNYHAGGEPFRFLPLVNFSF